MPNCNKTQLMLIFLTSMSASATSRMAYAEVQLKNGTPCFSISKKKKHATGFRRLVRSY